MTDAQAVKARPAVVPPRTVPPVPSRHPREAAPRCRMALQSLPVGGLLVGSS